MSKFMDKEGVEHRERKEAQSEVRAFEKMLTRLITEHGATIPEAVWVLQSALHTAIGNVQFASLKKGEQWEK